MALRGTLHWASSRLRLTVSSRAYDERGTSSDPSAIVDGDYALWSDDAADTVSPFLDGSHSCITYPVQPGDMIPFMSGDHDVTLVEPMSGSE